jgi:hypothetical protein
MHGNDLACRGTSLRQRRRAAQLLGVLDAEHAAQGVSLIALVNATNRLAVITRKALPRRTSVARFG